MLVAVWEERDYSPSAAGAPFPMVQDRAATWAARGTPAREGPRVVPLKPLEGVVDAQPDHRLQLHLAQCIVEIERAAEHTTQT